MQFTEKHRDEYTIINQVNFENDPSTILRNLRLFANNKSQMLR